MSDPVIISPTLTLAGQARAFAASNDGIELKISHVSYGVAHYDPTGNEVALTSPVGHKVPVAGAARPTPYQIRMISSWREDVGDVDIGEIGFWAGDVLVFVWSKADRTILSRKTNGVSYVLFCDLSFASAPANSISFIIDPQEGISLAALAAHESAMHAHPQYILRSKFPDYQGYLWGITAGTADAIQLMLPAIVDLTEYSQGNRFTFKALFDNTGDTSIEVNSAGPVQVLKTGGVPLTAGSIIKGGVYDVLYDGGSFQLTAGAGFASAEATTPEVTTTPNPNSTSWVSVRRLIEALELKANVNSPVLTGTPKAPTATPGTNDEQIGTTAFIQEAIAALVNNAPVSLNTLSELAAALGNDPDFANTVATALGLKAPLASPNFTGRPTGPTPDFGDNSLSLSTTAFVQRAIAALVDSSPAALDTLKELATALGNDPNFATTIATALGLKAPLASPNFTGKPTGPTPDFGDNSLSLSTTAFVQRAIAALVDSSPAALDTLKELATALGNDPNFATTITTALSLKAPLQSPYFTGHVKADGDIYALGRLISTGNISIGEAFITSVGNVFGTAWGGYLSDYLASTYEPKLGYVPVQQGGGEDQYNNKVFIGWNGEFLTAQVDNDPQGRIWTENIAVARAVWAQSTAKAGGIGTYALMVIGGGVATGYDPLMPGQLVTGASCAFTNTGAYNGGGPATGTWQVMGMVQNRDGLAPDSTTLCLRVA